MTLGERIKFIRESRDLTLESLGDLCNNKSKQTIWNWENNKNEPDIASIIIIAELGKVTYDWLLTGEESNFTPPITDLTKVHGDAHKVELDMYPLVEKVTAGNYQLITTQENVIEYFPLPVKRKNSFLVEVEGDSMISDDPNKSIQPGDMLLVDISEVAMAGDIVVVLLSNERQMVKQLFHKNGTVELRSYNSDYPPIYVEHEEIVCIYRVVYHQPKGKKL